MVKGTYLETEFTRYFYNSSLQLYMQTIRTAAELSLAQIQITQTKVHKNYPIKIVSNELGKRARSFHKPRSSVTEG